MKAYQYQYGELLITYQIEGEDILIKSISGYDIDFIDADDIKDIKFQCGCDFSDLQFKTYLKTGQII